MKRIIWICSIYPNNTDPFIGDFIERHAKAASLYNKITVIHVYTGSRNEHTTKTYNENLSAELICTRMNSFHVRWLQQLKIFILYFSALRKYIIKNGRPDLLHVNYVRSAGIVAAIFSFVYSVPYVITEHWSGFLCGSKNLLDTVCFKKAKLVSSVSTYLSEKLQSIFKLQEVKVIPNVVDTNIFFPKSSFSQPYVFLHNSGEESIKRSMEVVKAFASRGMSDKNAQLHLYGVFRQDISDFITEHNLQNQVFQHGMIEHDLFSTALANANCLVQYSSVETFGCIVAEALCCGVPVIVSDIPAMREMVQHNVHGLIVPNDNLSELTRAMHDMVIHSERFHKQLIAEYAQSKFSFPVVAEKIDELYQSAL